MNHEIITTHQPDALAFVANPDPDALQSVLAMGDLSKLQPPQRLQFLAAMCRSLGLNPLTSPFEFVSLSGKLRIYAKKDCTEQLRKLHDVSLEIISREWIQDIYVVTARAKMSNGRQDESIGAVSVAGLKGDALANAAMKAETKAKRRVTLSICGLGFLDESEVQGIHEHKPTVGTVYDPYAAPAVPALPEPAHSEPEPVEAEPPAVDNTTWQELHPKGWRAYLDAIGDYPKDDAGLGKAWAKERNNPALCAWAAGWITKTMREFADMEWPEVREHTATEPANLEDCTPEDLWRAAAWLRKLKADEAKKGGAA